MDTRQLGFDFFDTNPEVTTFVKKDGPKNVEASKELSNIKIVQAVVSDISLSGEDEIEGAKAEIEILVPEAELIVVDEEVREIELEPIMSRVKKERPAKKSGRGRMRLSDMDLMVDLVEVPEDEVLFQKSYYGISEVSNMFKVNISLIRFWENEFDILKPKKNGKGDRLFRPEDIKNLQLIYHLLREKKYTIEGARDFLKKNKKAEETFELIESLKKTKVFLLDLKANL